MSALQSKTDLANLTLPTHSSQLSSKVYNDMIKKTLYDKLVTKFNAIDTKIAITSGIVTRTQHYYIIIIIIIIIVIIIDDTIRLRLLLLVAPVYSVRVDNNLLPKVSQCLAR